MTKKNKYPNYSSVKLFYTHQGGHEYASEINFATEVLGLSVAPEENRIWVKFAPGVWQPFPPVPTGCQ